MSEPVLEPETSLDLPGPLLTYPIRVKAGVQRGGRVGDGMHSMVHGVEG